MRRIYLGLNAARNVREIFRATDTPTDDSHGASYNAVIGPFESALPMRGGR